MTKLQGRHPHTKSRKEEIINAALACFSEQGFTETSMSDICKKANASTGSLYHHFKSKEQLSKAVYLEGISQYQSSLLNILAEKKNAFEGIRVIISFHLKWVETNMEWSKFLFQQRHAEFMAGTDEEFNKMNRDFATGISEWFIPLIKGEIKKMQWDLYIAIILGPCQEFARMYLSGKNRSTMDEAVTELAQSAWSSLRAK